VIVCALCDAPSKVAHCYYYYYYYADTAALVELSAVKRLRHDDVELLTTLVFEWQSPTSMLLLARPAMIWNDIVLPSVSVNKLVTH